MSDDDLIRRGDALAKIREEAWPEDGTYLPHEKQIEDAERATVEVIEDVIRNMPAVTVGVKPVAHAYVIDGECEQIEWGIGIDLLDDPALVLLYAHPAPEVRRIISAFRELLADAEQVMNVPAECYAALREIEAYEG